MIIKTKHLILRSFQNGDEFDLLEYLKEVTVNCFIDMKINKIEEAINEVNERIKKSEYYFAIVLESENKVIGEIEVDGKSCNFTSKINDTFSPCWILNNKYQGRDMLMRPVWLSIDGMTHPLIDNNYESLSCPRICWYNYREENRKMVMTLNITINHCFVDCYPLSKAFNLIQEYFNNLTGIKK